MQRDDAYLLDIKQVATLAIQYIADLEEAEFLLNTQLQDSVVRRLEIIGEAAKRLSSESKSLFPTLPWKEMVGMRNFMIHEYDNIDFQLVWNTVKEDLPKIVKLL